MTSGAASAVGARPLRVGVFGASLDTGNLGVSALGVATVRGILEVEPAARVTLFDNGTRPRSQELRAGDWRATVDLVPSVYSRRFYRLSNQQQAWFAARMGLGRLHPFLRRLADLDAVLDISGGDSFSDLYGPRRFRWAAVPKRLALRSAPRLVLLPQTYGPFGHPGRRAAATELIAGAQQAWTRDLRGLEVLRSLLGDRFDTGRHRAGVDVAFGLPSRVPDTPGARECVDRVRAGSRLVFGLNVSGLLYFPSRRARFGLRGSYRDLVHAVASRLLEEPGSQLLLVSHVADTRESDLAACRDLLSRLPAALRSRVVVAPACEDPMEAKWIIGHCDWFCGSRMHACIAGLSQGVPTTTIAYSDKSLGVFETVDSGDWVFDPRARSGPGLVDAILGTLAFREERSTRLRRARDEVDAVWRDQFRRIVAPKRDTRRSSDAA